MATPAEIAALRTLALVGPATSGKTTLAEALLWKAGAIGSPGTVERGSTVSDWDPLEKKAQRSLNRKGKIRLKAKFTFTPTGGTTASRTKTLKLVRKR